MNKSWIDVLCFFLSSLDSLTQSSTDLCRHLMDFISEFQDLPSVLDWSNNNNKFEPALPTKSIFFDGAKLELWRGR